VVQQGSPDSRTIGPPDSPAAINGLLSVLVCVAVSLGTAPPPTERITDQVTINWRRLNVFDNLGSRWYTSVVTWWILFVVVILAALGLFSGLCFPTSSSP